VKVTLFRYLAACVFVSTIFFSIVSADFSNNYFQKSDAPSLDGTYHDVSLVAGYGRYTNNANVNVFIYFPDDSGSVTINNKDWCKNAANPMRDQKDTGAPPYGIAGTTPMDIEVTTYSLTGYNGGAEFYGYSRTWDAVNNRCGNGSDTYNVSSLPQDSLGRYYAKLTATIYNPSSPPADFSALIGILNFFSISALNSGNNANNVFIAQAGGTSGYEATIQSSTRPSKYYDYDVGGAQASNNSDFINYKIHFGSDCTVTSDRPATITLYDLDNPGDVDNDDTNTQDFKYVNVGLYRSDGTIVALNSVVLTRSDGTTTSLPVVGNTFTPQGSNNGTIRMNFTAEPAGQYELRLNNVFNNNTIQFSTPYDGIFWYPACKPSIDLLPSVNPNPLESGGAGTGSAQIENTSLFNTGSFNYTWDVWYDTGDSLFNEPAGNMIGTQTTGTSSLIAYGTLTLPNKGFTTTPPTGSTQVCSKIVVTGAGGNVTFNSVDPLDSSIGMAVACVPIAKYPAMKVSGGDVRTGGGFLNGTACQAREVINTTSNRQKIIGHQYITNPSGLRGSKAQYAVTGINEILFFGAGDYVKQWSGVAVPTSETEARKWMFGSQAWAGAGSPYSQSGLFWGTPVVTPTTYCLADIPSAFPLTTSGNDTSGGNATYNLPSVSTGTTSMINTISSNGQVVTLNTNGLTLQPNQRLFVKFTGAAGSSTYNANATASNTVKLNGDLKYAPGPYASVGELPLFVLYGDKDGGNIAFSSTTGEVNGVFYAKGNLYTCYTATGIWGPSNASTSNFSTTTGCNNALRLNGTAVLGGRLFPYRTAGYDTVADWSTYAETITLKPETYLALFDQAQRTSNTIAVEDQKELAPRY